MKIQTVMVAALMAAAMSLAGCGGGSSTPPTDPQEQAEKERMERRMMQLADIRTASTGVVNAQRNLMPDKPTDAQIGTLNTAITGLERALANAPDVEDEVKAGYQNVLTSARSYRDAAQETLTAMALADEKKRMDDMAAVGKALHAALAGNVTANTNALGNIAAPSLTSTGLTIDAAENAGAIDRDNPDPVILKAGSSVGSLSGWMGMDYALSSGTGDAKVTNEARVYSNPGPNTRIPFAEGGHTTNDDGEVTTVVADLVMASAFEHPGTKTHQRKPREDAVYINGTYDGAPGTYSCTGTDPCTSTNDGEGGPSALGGTWIFTPTEGAMVSRPDAHYLYYGWWVSKDSDESPTAASAFAGRVGTDGDDDNLDLGWSGPYSSTAGSETITGSASYSGSAAGKYAWNNVLDGSGHGGHFTADAKLEATFSGDEPGVTGTIDEFRLNDGSENPGWSVELSLGGFSSDGVIGDPDRTLVPAITDPKTTWSYNDNKAPASGTWGGTMYDGAVDGDANDGSNIPTTVTGTFYSEFSSIGRMVGAFGADLDD